jgi:hypothetical protein
LRSMGSASALFTAAVSLNPPAIRRTR